MTDEETHDGLAKLMTAYDRADHYLQALKDFHEYTQQEERMLLLGAAVKLLQPPLDELRARLRAT